MTTDSRSAQERDGARRPALATIEGVQKVFARKRAKPVTAVGGVSFEVGEGELVSLLGPSGCGKTTLLRIVAGLTAPSAGRVLVRGTEVTGPQPDFGMAFQAPVLLPWRTCLGNVLFTMEVLHRGGPTAVERARELLDAVGLSGFEDQRPAALSGGMQQRVALCRALVHEPSLLLMDEPFGALDELTRMEMHDLLLSLRARVGCTALLVTHSISEAVYLSDRVLVFSARPARLLLEISVDLPYPRHAHVRHTDTFNAIEERIETALGLGRP
ncbi:MAG: ABC transporter ATP-binding protein [Nocardioidaceae bacterium]